MNNIRKEVSNIFGYAIPEGEWDEALESLNRDGRLTFKHLYKIVIVLLKKEEERELLSDGVEPTTQEETEKIKQLAQKVEALYKSDLKLSSQVKALTKKVAEVAQRPEKQVPKKEKKPVAEKKPSGSVKSG